VRSRNAIVSVALTVVAAFAICVAPAYASNEVTNLDDYSTSPLPVRTTCVSCHDEEGGMGGRPPAYGAHGGYLTTTTKCIQCHAVHRAPADSILLLPGATITATCNACHDGTGGEGVYGAIIARTGREPAANHSTEATSMIPGGDSASGGSISRVFGGENGTLTCTDCHAAHGANVVTAFRGDRLRTDWSWWPSMRNNPLSSKLLKQRPGNSATATVEYGSDWCLGCHEGRASGLSSVHNHPVESSATAAPSTPFVYRNLPIVTGTSPSTQTALGSLGGSNAGFLMPFPRTTGASGQEGHGPICQQCHDDARSVGSLSSSGAASVAPIVLTPPYWEEADGYSATDNPRFTTFPHETLGYRMLVESTQTAYFDDLCLNCHPSVQLP
jgi:predicted CXXCH cytochrome family protein